MKPHPSLGYVTPDELGECWNGVSESLYKALWDCVDHYTPINYEDNGPHDVIGINAVTKFWSRFTPQQQAELNKLAVEHS